MHTQHAPGFWKRRVHALIALMSVVSMTAAGITIGTQFEGEGSLASAGHIGLEPVDDLEPEGESVGPVAGVALGDSTMALSNGVVLDRLHNCRHEEGSWPMLLDGVVNISCSGADVQKITKLARRASEIDEGTRVVYITAGTNSLRLSLSDDEVSKHLSELVDVVRGRAPGVRVVFVGYLSVSSDSECMSPRWERIASHFNRLHEKADDIMESVAKVKDADYIDTSGGDYPECGKDESYIHLPDSGKGTAWHTTMTGHRYVAGKVEEFLTKHPM